MTGENGRSERWCLPTGGGVAVAPRRWPHTATPGHAAAASGAGTLRLRDKNEAKRSEAVRALVAVRRRRFPNFRSRRRNPVRRGLGECGLRTLSLERPPLYIPSLRNGRGAKGGCEGGTRRRGFVLNLIHPLELLLSRIPSCSLSPP